MAQTNLSTMQKTLSVKPKRKSELSIANDAQKAMQRKKERIAQLEAVARNTSSDTTGG